MDTSRIIDPSGVKSGLRAGLVIALGYIPVAVTFGLLAHAAGLPSVYAALMSLIVYAGASQFIGLNMMSLGASVPEIVMTTFIVNIRHFLMSAALAGRIAPGAPRRTLGLIAFGVTDESFAVASMQGGTLGTRYMLALNFTAFAAWNAGTWIGLAAGAALPQALQQSMGISLYAMFIGLLLPALRRSKPAAVVAAVSMGMGALLTWAEPFAGLSSGWIVLISALAASTAGALIYPQDEEEERT